MAGNSNQNTASEKLQTGISDKIMELLDSVIQSRGKYWDEHPQSAPQFKDVTSLIGRAARTAAAVGFGCNLVPGPWGMAAILPEIALILKIQLEMLYDIGRAYGHKNITRELLLGLLLSGTGSSTGGLIVIVGGKVVVKRATLRFLQKLIALLGGKITQRVLKSFLAKWVPIAGAAAMAAWANYSTQKLGEGAQKIYAQPIIIDAEEVDSEPTSDSYEITLEHIRLMVSMVWVDRKLDGKEHDFVHALLENPELAEADRLALKEALKTGKVGSVNYEAFTGHPDDQVATLMDLIVLAKIDNRVHPAETALIREVGKKFGLASDDVEKMMAIEFSDLDKSSQL